MSMGDNVGVPYAEGVTERLELDYAELLANTSNLIDGTETLPSNVENSKDMTSIAAMVVKLRDLAMRSESHRKAEGEPYLRSKEAVDAFFFRRVKEPADAKRKDLQGRLDVFKQRQLAEERARREAEAARARKAQLEAEKLRVEAEAAARRARSEGAAEQRKAEAVQARAEAAMADAEAEAATLATMAKAGAMVSERFEGTERSGQVTMRKMPVVFIDDVAKLDLELLRPFIKEEALLMALRGWAKATNYAQEMPGATVALRELTVVR